MTIPREQMIEQLMEAQMRLVALDGNYLRDFFRAYFGEMTPKDLADCWQEMLEEAE
jgi:hypothetical protein